MTDCNTINSGGGGGSVQSGSQELAAVMAFFIAPNVCNSLVSMLEHTQELFVENQTNQVMIIK